MKSREKRRREAIRRMRTLLLGRREALRQSLDFERSQIETKGNYEVGDPADLAVDAEAHEISSRLAQAESDEIARVDSALARMENGSYGVCVDCGRKIPMARLQVVPCAESCFRCQNSRENVRFGPDASLRMIRNDVMENRQASTSK